MHNRASTTHKPSIITLDRIPPTKPAPSSSSRNASHPPPHLLTSFSLTPTRFGSNTNTNSTLRPGTEVDLSGQTTQLKADLKTHIWSAAARQGQGGARDGEVRVNTVVDTAVSRDLETGMGPGYT
jgi:hypothetical protein